MSESIAASGPGETVGTREPGQPGQPGGSGGSGRPVVVRYWAAARAAAGVDRDEVSLTGEATLASVLETVRALHVDQPRFKDVLAVCSVLIGDRPVGRRDPHEVDVRPGDTVEMLPPFAGG